MPQGQGSPSRAQLLTPVRREVNGTIYEFPPGTSDADINVALQTIVPAPPSTVESVKGLATGFGKGLGRQAIDLGKLMIAGDKPILMQSLMGMGTPPQLTAQNPSEGVGSFMSDVATIALPSGMAAKGARGAQNLAARMWQKAAGQEVGTGTSIAENAMERGLGRLTRGNYDTLRNQGQKMTADVMKRGVERAEASPASIDPIRLLMRPQAQAAIAQGLYRTAPGVQATGAGLGALGLREVLAQMLGGGR